MAYTVQRRQSPITATFTRSAAEQREKQHNILYILVDDASVEFLPAYNYMHSRMGYSGSVTLPLMTNLATHVISDSVKFSNCYTMPVCSAHRLSVLTGRYPGRHGCGNVVMPKFATAEFNEAGGTWSDEYTIAHLLGDAGYRTLMCGKNHLSLLEPGDEEDFPEPTYPYTGTGWGHPITSMGFDEFRGTLRNLTFQGQTPSSATAPADGATIGPGYYNFRWNEVRKGDADMNPSPPRILDTHITRYGRQRIEDWIDNPDPADAGKPWFVYWALSATHTPLGGRTAPSNSGCAPPDEADYLESAPGTWSQTQAWGSVCASLENISVEIGKLHDTLGAEVWADTMVFFMADNGSAANPLISAVNDEGETGFGTVSPGYAADVIFATNPDRMKASVYSGGTRAALFVSGPLVVNGTGSARISETLVDGVDLFETFRRIGFGNASESIIDNSARPNDSVSFYDVLRDVESDSTTLRTTSFSEHFVPNGDPGLISDTSETVFDGSSNHVKDRVWRKRRADGDWHLVRRRVGTSNVDELYHVTNASFAAVDFNEQTDLRVSQNAVYQELLVEMAAHLADMASDPTHS